MRFHKFSTASLAHREGVDEKLIEISDLALQLTIIDFGHGPYSGLRTVEEQTFLFADGRSRADGFVNRSKHQDGKALDFFAYIGGKISYEKEHMAMVGAAFLQAASILGYKVQWGGLWPTKDDVYGWDMPHIQLID